MKAIFLATGDSPDYYEFDEANEIITAHKDGASEAFDLSTLQEGDEFEGLVVDTLDLNGTHIIRDAERVNGELHLTLCQFTSNNWEESDEIDVSNYDQTELYVKNIR